MLDDHGLSSYQSVAKTCTKEITNASVDPKVSAAPAGQPTPERPDTQSQPETTTVNRLLDIARFIASQDSQLRLEDGALRLLWDASEEAPITAASLSALDPTRLPEYARLYHAANFEGSLVLRPEEKSSSKVWWAVLAVEFALYIQHNASTSKTSLLNKLTAIPGKGPKLRLPRLLKNLKEILQTLVPANDAKVLEFVFDVDLVLQQIRNDNCNLVSLMEWIVALLKRSCCWQRDVSVAKLIETIRGATRNGDPCLLASTIEQLFTTIEAIKLVRHPPNPTSRILTSPKDLFNSYIGSQRPFLVADSVDCIQKYFKNRIEKGWTNPRIAAWYSETVFSHDSPLEHIARLHIDSIVGESPGLPETFDYDRERFEALHLHYRRLCVEMAISSTIAYVVDCISPESQNTCLRLSETVLGAATRRVMKVDPFLSFWTLSPNDPNSSFSAITLEIARTASIFRRKRSTPHQEDIILTQTQLLTMMGHNLADSPYPTCISGQQDTRQPQCPGGDSEIKQPESLATQHVRLRTQLQVYVRHELARIRGMSEAEIFCLYVARKPMPTFVASRSGLKLHAGLGARTVAAPIPAVDKLLKADLPRGEEQFPNVSEQLHILAQRIAHMAIIHLRIWEPLLRS